MENRTATTVSVMSLGVSLLSAALAWQAMNQSQEATKSQLRAYVAASYGEVLGIEDSRGLLTVRIAFKNSGQTPAYQTQVQWEVDVWEQTSDDNGLTGAAPPTPIVEGAETTLAAGQEIVVEYQLPADVRSELLNGSATILAEGQVIYVDSFGETHREPFHYIQGGDYNPKAKRMGVGY